MNKNAHKISEKHKPYHVFFIHFKNEHDTERERGGEKMKHLQEEKLDEQKERGEGEKGK